MLFKSLHHDEGGNRAMPEVTMPRLSDTMQEGTIARWLKSPGDKVNKGEILGEIETDKATMDLESYDAGVLEQILVQEGATVPIGQPIAIIGSGAGREASPKQEEPATVSAASSKSTEQAGPAMSASASYLQRESVAAGASSDGPRIKACPLAPRIADTYKVHLA